MCVGDWMVQQLVGGWEMKGVQGTEQPKDGN